MRKTAVLRQLINRESIAVAPGAYDALSARLIEQAGFEIVYMSGGGAACSLLGQPDLGFLGLEEMSDQAARIVAVTTIPVIADCDTGFGNALNVIRAVERYECAGVAGLHLEDQVFPKRCGHLAGKQVIPAAEFAEKLRAAVSARSDPDLVIIARTDSRALHGLHEVLERAARFADAGADLFFPEGLESPDEVSEVAEAAGIPLLINQVPGGQAPVMPHEQLLEAGCRIVIYPSTALSSTIKAVEVSLADLAKNGSQSQTATLGVSQIFARVGLKDWQERERRFPPTFNQSVTHPTLGA